MEMSDGSPKSPVSPPAGDQSDAMTSQNSRHTNETMVAVNSRKKSNNTGAAKIHSDFIRAKTVKDSGEHPAMDRSQRYRRLAKRWTNNPIVSQFMALVVLFDAYCNCNDIDARAQGRQVNPALNFAAGMCLILYTIELWLIVLGQGVVVFKDWVFWADAGVICVGYGEIIMDFFTPEGELADRIGILRLLRLGRVLRLLQLLRKTRALRELQKLVTMMSTCLKALAWSFIFCFVVMTIWAMLMVEIIYPLIQELNRVDPTIFADCPQCTRATSSVMDANLLLFKTVIAGDSWGTIAVPVIEAYPATAMIFVGSLLTLVFGVLNLIVAVVVDTFADARDRDILNLAEEMEADMEADKRFLEGVFNRIDVNGTGELTLDQLVEGARTDTEFQSRLKVMDIDEMDLVQLFEMIDTDNSGAIEPDEFIRPLSRWVRDSKTAPRFIKYNLMRVMHKQDELQSEQAELQRVFQHCFDDISQRLEQLQTGSISSERRSFMELRESLTAPGAGTTSSVELRCKDVGPIVEIVEQPHSSEKVTLKRLSETQGSVDDAMERLESLVLRATESALKESTVLVKHLLLEEKSLETLLPKDPPWISPPSLPSAPVTSVDALGAQKTTNCPLSVTTRSAARESVEDGVRLELQDGPRSTARCDETRDIT